MSFAPDEITCDGFLDGRLQIFQPKKGYRAAADPVFLAASVPASAGQSVLELGCGVAVASFCLAKRITGLNFTGVELQPDYAELAQKNSRMNSIDVKIVIADLTDLPDELRHSSFDHVIFNPPFFVASATTIPQNNGKNLAHVGTGNIDAWVDVALRRLHPGGRLTLIHLAERLPEILRVLGDRVGGIEIKPIVARQGQPAGRVIVRARKAMKSPARLYFPLVVHTGATHAGDRDSFTEAAQKILRTGLPMEF